MAYSELIKNFERIRDYMRQFYVYGFKSRTDYDQKSFRTYDNERRRMESWLGAYMSFRQTADGKNVFLSVDSRAIPGNPLYNAFKAKSFTSGDVTFHFYILDLLADGEAYTAQEIVDLFCENYLSSFDSLWMPDLSTVRKKLKEYVSLGILKAEKQGRELRYSRNDSGPDPEDWAEAAAFFAEANPLGVVGAFLLDKLEEKPDWFRFKHHYILHTLDSQILLRILMAMGEKRRICLTNLSIRSKSEAEHMVYPLKIYISTQGGRQYLLCWHYQFQKLMFFRLDYIRSVVPGCVEEDHEQLMCRYQQTLPCLWGTSAAAGEQIHHLEMIVSYGPKEDFILNRLEREKRNGTVEILDDHTCRYTADVYDALEMIPWLRTFIGRIEKLSCTDPRLEERFYEDLDQMYALYGGEADAVQ